MRTVHSFKPLLPPRQLPPIGEEETFQKALSFTLSWEGGLSTNQRDPGNYGGKVTQQGVTQRTYDVYRSKNKLPLQSVVKMNTEEMEHLYHSEYYLPLRPALLPSSTSFALFDTAVNVGPRRAIHFLQRSLGVRADGIIGPKTLRAANTQKEAIYLGKFISQREEHYRALATSERYAPFLRGWLNRCQSLRRHLALFPL